MNRAAIRHLIVIATALVGTALPGPSAAVSVSFNAYNAAAPQLDLSVDITLQGNSALFEFTNNSTGPSAGSSLARIYFETGLLSFGLSNGVVSGGVGTDFHSIFPGPSSPPAGNTVGWAGELASFGASSPPPRNGLNVADSLLIVFDYSGTLGALIDAITDENGNARVAGHVLDCIGGNSCAAQTTAVVPLPAALPLFFAALAGLGVLWRPNAV